MILLKNPDIKRNVTGSPKSLRAFLNLNDFRSINATYYKTTFQRVIIKHFKILMFLIKIQHDRSHCAQKL